MSSSVVTGEAVPLDLPIARLPSRLIAAAIDIAIGYIGLFLTLMLLAYTADGLDQATAQAIAVTLLVGFLIAYPVLFLTFSGGRTLGKMAMGLRVVRDDGGPISFRQALTRELVGFVVEKPGISLGVLAVVSSLVREDSKRVGDLAAGTIVISERVPGGVIPPPQMPPQLAAWAATLDLSRLPTGLALQARQLLARAHGLEPGAREAVGARLVADVTAFTGPPPAGTPGWAVLAAVLAER
ncbi:MAG TPA: RDD family protein, partial [Mycobacteriales bacterium]|nr:RDD family protein [Mycobacteriales bacterium]